MAYWAPKFEHRNKQREEEYDKKHLADCQEVKTYKLTPEEIQARYGDCKGQGGKVSSLANVRNLTIRPEVDEMGKIYETQEVLEAVKRVMEEKGITEHSLGARDIAKHLKKYETTIYNVIGGMTGLANALDLPTIQEYKAQQRASKEEIKPLKEVSEEEFENVYVQAYPEPLVFTVTSEDKPVKCPLFAEYQKKVDECMGLEVEIIALWNQREEKQSELLKLENWLEGFEAAAKLAGVSLE